jgi:HEAT repeat protein
MRTAIAGLIVAILACGTARGAEASGVEEFYLSLDDALLDMGMTSADFLIRSDYAEPDIFRLPLVDSLMEDPASLLDRMDRLAAEAEAVVSLADCSSLLWDAMSVEPDRSVALEPHFPVVEDIAGRLGHLRPPLDRLITSYLIHLERMACLRDRALAGAAADLDFLYGSLPLMLAPSPDYEGIGPFELHRLEKEEEALNDSVLSVLEKVDMRAVAGLSLEALVAAGEARLDARQIAGATGESMRYRGRGVRFSGVSSSATGDVIYMGLSPYGPVVIGDTSRTVYDGCFALIIDPGGDDVYNLTDDRRVHFRMIVDVSGDDIYRSPGNSGLAGAITGTSVVMDLAGDDSYRSGDMSLGAGICGIGVIEDMGGNDSYTSGVFSQGAGFLGLGILKDDRGHDTYVSGMQSQAFGYVMGSGLLLERGGNDTYHTRMSQTDILRYDDHYLTLSQGCAFGSRPDYSGGIGLLVDSRGNDVYSSDIFGQGVAYWFAAGALVDRSGHDRYCSYQYAQGAGIHLAFGLLLDNRGDDGYISKGVSQGCGHDLSLGLLADLSGNDWYTATDLSQGAGNANGTGIIYDADGNDAYASKDRVNVNGYGNYRREFGSLGLHLDVRGRDFYSARGEDGSLWESGRYGLGVDVPGDAGRPAGDLVVAALPLRVRDFTSEELFILSSRGEPRFAEWHDYGFDSMVEDTTATIAYLRTVLDTKDARERHTIKDILRRIGEPALPMLAEAVTDGGPKAKAEASWILGLIGSREAFDPLLELSRAEGWKLRSSAINALAKLDNLSRNDLERLEERVRQVLADPHEVCYVKKDAAYACGAQGLCGSLDLLCRALEDQHFAVRFSAAEAIRDLSEASCAAVAETVVAQLGNMGPAGTAALLHAAGKLTPAEKLEVAEALIASKPALASHEKVALARLLGGTEPRTPEDTERLDAIIQDLGQDSWKVQALVGKR